MAVRRAPVPRSRMLSRLKPLATRLLTPVARALLRAGIGPDGVTLLGTLGVVLAALVLLPRGNLLAGAAVAGAFALSDTLDGTMARLSGRTSSWGAFLDSVLDRFADAAVFSGLVLWYSGGGASPVTAALALGCLVLGSVVSYAKARAEGLGLTADVGIAARTDRLVAVLVATGLVGLGLPVVVLTVVLGLLALASAWTVWQRVREVRRQALARTA